MSTVVTLLAVTLAVPNSFAAVTGDEIQAQLLPLPKSDGGMIPVQIKVSVKPGWHVYGLHPGDMGRPPKISVELSDGVVAGDVAWPTDHTFEMGTYHCAGYSDDFIVNTSLQITEAQKIKKDSAATVIISWLACDGDACVPGKARLAVPLA